MNDGVSKNNFLLVIGVAVLAGLVGALAAVFAVKALETGGNEPAKSPPNALEMIDAFSCKKGLNKRVILRGIPDNFDRTQTEPTQMRAELANIAMYQDGVGTRERYYGREYDEGGADRQLIDQVEIPRGIVSGSLLIGLKPAAHNENDTISINDLEQASNALTPLDRKFQFGYPVSNLDAVKVEGSANLYSIELSQFSHRFGKDILDDFLNLRERTDTVDLQVVDDTMVDFAAFLLCQEPATPKAVTMHEHRRISQLPELSIFSCSLDGTQPLCDAYQGDIACNIAAPIACYKDGRRKRPEGVLEKLRFDPSTFVGGEVRLSKPTRGDEFASLAEVDAMCTGEFGKGWRTLELNESGTAALISYSDIEPESFGIVNVSNQPYANCWDRPKSVMNDQ